MKRIALTFCLLGVIQVPALAQKIRLTTPDGATTIHPGDVLRISARPAMPDFKAKMNPGNGIVGWVLTSEYDPRSEDDQRLPASGSVRLDAEKPWLPHLQASRGFFGGDVTIQAKESGRTYESNFIIYGRNPKDADAKRYINSRSGRPWFAYAIAQHESRQGERVYNQFNTTDPRLFEPVRTGGRWGMFKIRSATTEETWNWKENVKAGVKELQETKREAQSYFNAIKRNFPFQYEEPPDYQPPGSDTVLTAIEAAQMQLYDEASVEVVLPDSNRNLQTYRSCWSFNPNGIPGFKWTFVPNRNNYVRAVVVNEIDGGLPTKE